MTLIFLPFWGFNSVHLDQLQRGEEKSALNIGSIVLQARDLDGMKAKRRSYPAQSPGSVPLCILAAMMGDTLLTMLWEEPHEGASRIILP